MKRILIACLSIVTLCLSEIACKQFSPNRDDVKFKETQRLFTTIPIYEGSEEVDSSWSSKDNVARVGKAYKVRATYDELKHHYVESLTKLGWKLEREREIVEWGRNLGGRELYFRDGEYYVAIQYAGEKADYGWDYGLSVGWRRE